jgi:serine/threonine protein kinase/tetratricopeptide (TPR) repeat protein
MVAARLATTYVCLPHSTALTSDLRVRLQAILGSAFTLERELGGGGMSRVFLAHEVGLQRTVVVKVLAPEITAGVSLERFQREVRIAARLQEPHIVPVLTTGVADELPYYTMPFVKGESLRVRLARGAIPQNEAVSLLRDVALALEHAHAHDVVHRDIKPENILLSGRSAMVTDFGIAKALRVARTEEVRPGALTLAGTSLGTPAYMAPEQALGDVADHRADLYAWGVVAYETLAGEHPFAGKISAQQLIAAHITEAPVPISAKSRAIPEVLATLIMRCLEKDPASRPQSADELLVALDGVRATNTGSTSPSDGSTHSKRHRRRIAFVSAASMVVLAASLVAVAARRTRVATAVRRPRVLVVPLTDRTDDAALSQLGRVAGDWLVEGLAASEFVDVISSAATTTNARSVVGPREAADAASSDRALATRAGADFVVSGSYDREGDSVRFQGKIVDCRVRGPDLSAAATVQILSVGMTPLSEPMRGVEALRQRVLGALASALDERLIREAALERRPPTFEAYKEFVAGMEYFFARNDYQSAIPYLSRAGKLDTTFIRPRLYEAIAYINLAAASDAAWAPADSVAATIERIRERLSPWERDTQDFIEATIRGDLAGAYRASRQAAVLSSGSESDLTYAGFARRIGRVHESLAVLQRLDPERGMLRGWGSYWGGLTASYHQLARYGDELAVARRGRALYPENITMRVYEVRALAALGREDEVYAQVPGILTQAPRGTITPGYILRLAGEEFLTHGHPTAAHGMLEQAVAWDAERARQGGDSVKFRMSLGQSLYAAGRNSEAVAVFSVLSRGDTGSISYRGYLGVLAARLGDQRTAASVDSGLAASRRPYLRGTQFLWEARIAATLGQREKGAALLRTALAQGVGFDTFLHTDPALSRMRGFGPFDAILRVRD